VKTLRAGDNVNPTQPFLDLPKILKTNQKFLKTKKYSQLLVTES